MCTFLDCESPTVGLLLDLEHLAKVALAQDADFAEALLKALELDHFLRAKLDVKMARRHRASRRAWHPSTRSTIKR